MNYKILLIILATLIVGRTGSTSAQEKLQLSLEQVIELAQQQSLEAFINENMYLSSQWEYKAFKAQKRPWLEVSSNPAQYSNSIEVVTDKTGSFLNRSEKFSSNGTLSLSQNIMLTGGDISIYSNLSRLKNFSDNNIYFGSTPISLGLSQPLFQYNSFKWEKKIAPLKFEIAKKEYIKSAEEIAMQAINYFFNLLDAEQAYKIAELNKISADSLYIKSMGRYENGAIAYMDLQRLELNMLNSQTSFEQSQLNLERSKFNLRNYLRIPENKDVSLVVPDSIPRLKINPQEALNKATNNNPDILGFKQKLIEADRQIAQAKGNNGISSNLDVNIGWSKSGGTMQEAYQDFDRDRGVSVSLYIPIVDWGMSRGRREIAKSNKKVTVATVEMQQISFEQDVLMSTIQFNMLESQLDNSKKANAISGKTYNTVEERFLLGKVNLETLYAARNERDNALRSYYSRIRQYWNYFYYMRSITLYDFMNNKSLAEKFEQSLGL